MTALATFDIRDAGPKAAGRRERIICGIDPGKSGAIAWLWASDIRVDPLPYLGRELDGVQLAGWLRVMRPDHVFLELAGARAEQSVQAGMTTFANYGVIKGVLAALAVPYTLAAPGKWKRDMGLSADKNLSRALAARTWPEAACLRGARGAIIEGRAEAALIALWGSRQ